MSRFLKTIVLLIATPPVGPTCWAQEPPSPVVTQMITLRLLVASQYAVEGAMAAIKTCDEGGTHALVVIVDSGGNTRLIMVGDGGNYNLVEDARRKAYTAATLNQPTAALQKALVANPHMQLKPDAQLLTVGGGVPILTGTAIVGGIGVAGGAPEVEDRCAQAGVDRLQSYLKAASTHS